MAKTAFLYERILPVALCLCMLPDGRAIAQKNSDSLRQRLTAIYRAELGVQEATGHNDGERVETYLRYTHLLQGQEWCAAFVSWCFGQAGQSQPRNPWSPALFPAARRIWQSGQPMSSRVQQADIFGIWDRTKGRIAHVGFIDGRQGNWYITVEGNVDNGVRRMRRHYRSLYCIADWLRE